MLLKLIVGPLTLIDELLERLLKRLKDTGVRSLYLCVVNRDFGIQLLCRDIRCDEEIKQ